MKQNITLLIMSAGMGSRFGGPKQIEPIGPNNELLIEYSIYNAIKVGYTKIVFIIKEEHYQIFKEKIGNKISSLVEVYYVFQNNDNIKNIVSLPSSRIKPYGTAHAIYCAKDTIKENFSIINADDFYSYDALKSMYDMLCNIKDSETCTVLYQLKNTIVGLSSCKRGVVSIKDNYVEEIIESSIDNINNELIASPLSGQNSFKVEQNIPVTMNLFGFTPYLFEYLDNDIKQFFITNKENLEKIEYLIPEVLDKMIKTNKTKMHSCITHSTWCGMTNKEDLDYVKNVIKELLDKKEFPINLWK